MNKIKHIIKNKTMWELKKNRRKSISNFRSLFIYDGAHVHRVNSMHVLVDQCEGRSMFTFFNLFAF